MNCWKTINLAKQYGTHRLVIMSSLTMLITFILLYVPASYLYVPASFSDDHFIAFLTSLVMVYPVHKMLHYLPLVHLGKRVIKTVEFKLGFCPLFYFRANEPISKKLFLVSLFSPFIINLLLLVLCFIFPNYVHYLTILIAYHMGISVSDFICVKNTLTAPKQSYIEEHEEGFEILIINSSSFN